MKILLAHNTYQYAGGEDSVLASEQELLRQHRHQCETAILSNKRVGGIFAKIRTALKTPKSKYGYDFAKKAILQIRPNIVHVHNFFPLLTPSIYDACIEAGIPVVQTLHNYRTICPGALLMRDGKICEKCVTGSPYQAILHRCYRNSIPGSWAVARMVSYHRKRQTWQNKVDLFIALTAFSRRKFIEAGFPEEKIMVKPNFYGETGKAKAGKRERKRCGVLFVGRLSREKGIATLLAAWQNLNVPLRVVGDGPLLAFAKNNLPVAVALLGWLDSQQVSDEMAGAAFLVMPSEWYETFGLVIIEAFAHGLPVVASRLGGMAEIVEDGVTGLHFEPGNPQDLAEKVQWLHDHPEECRIMGKNARKIYEEKYTPERNYELLMDIYQQAIENKKAAEVPPQ